jgi:tetratricopeptide (TPR) repeat protein
MEKFEESSKFYKGAAEDGEISKKALFNMANSYFGSQDFEKAEKIYKQILINNPHDIKAKYNLQVTLKRKKQSRDKQDKGDKKQNQKDKEPKSNDKQKQNKNGKSQKNRQPSMSAEDAQRLLEMVKESENKNTKIDKRRYPFKRVKGKPSSDLKDW